MCCQTCLEPSMKFSAYSSFLSSSSSVDSNNIITTTATTNTTAACVPPSTSNNSSYSINNNETIINNGNINNSRKGTNCLLSLFSVLDDFDGYTLGDLLRICCDVEVCVSIKLFFYSILTHRPFKFFVWLFFVYIYLAFKFFFVGQVNNLKTTRCA